MAGLPGLFQPLAPHIDGNPWKLGKNCGGIGPKTGVIQTAG